MPNAQKPLVYVGQIVRWKPHPGSIGGHPALVVTIGEHNLGLLVFRPMTVGGVPYDGVLHESDPRFSPERYQEEGVWGYLEDQDDYLRYSVERGDAK